MDNDEDAAAELIPVKDLTRANSNPDHVFNQQRAVVAKLERTELEDRYLRLLEENVVLKKHACKQEDKIKKLATKLIRVLSDKKRLEMSSGGIPGTARQIETEELIEDQQHKIRELERQVSHLRDRLSVAKQQLVGPIGGVRSGTSSGTTRRPRARSAVGQRPPPMSPSPVPPSATTAAPPSSVAAAHPGHLLSQQALRLLEEARNENRMLDETVAALKEKLNIFEQEVEQQREQQKIKESNYEEEIQILKAQVLDGQRHTATENIQLIQLHKDNNIKSAHNETLKAQVQGLEEQAVKLKSELQRSNGEVQDLSRQLQEEQKRSISLSEELTDRTSCRQELTIATEKMRDLQKENDILKESNNKLLDSAYNLERERQYQASENALKVQIAQLETTLKSDLKDKSVLQNALAKERERYAKLESDYNEMQGKYLTMKESLEGQEEKLSYFARENSIDMRELEEALMVLRKKKDAEMKNSVPSFLDEVDGVANKDLKAQLSELQVQYVESINELEKTRSLLRVQSEINAKQKKEVEALQARLLQVKSEYQGQLTEYKKLLDVRATRIQKMEIQLRDSAYSALQRNLSRTGVESGAVMAKEASVHTASGQSLFEIHVQQAKLTQESLVALGIPEPKVFVTWTFYDHDLQYTPMANGPNAVFDSSSYYKIRLDDSLLDFMSGNEVLFDLHLVVGSDCKHVSTTNIGLSEVLSYPSNKLHGSVILKWAAGKNKGTPMGTLDYWLKLHTAATQRISQWMRHKKSVERMIEQQQKAGDQPNVLTELDLLAGEDKQMQGRVREAPSAPVLDHPPEPEMAPRLPNVASKRPERKSLAQEAKIPQNEKSRKLSAQNANVRESEMKSQMLPVQAAKTSASDEKPLKSIQERKSNVLQPQQMIPKPPLRQARAAPKEEGESSSSSTSSGEAVKQDSQPSPSPRRSLTPPKPKPRPRKEQAVVEDSSKRDFKEKVSQMHGEIDESDSSDSSENDESGKGENEDSIALPEPRRLPKVIKTKPLEQEEKGEQKRSGTREHLFPDDVEKSEPKTMKERSRVNKEEVISKPERSRKDKVTQKKEASGKESEQKTRKERSSSKGKDENVTSDKEKIVRSKSKEKEDAEEETKAVSLTRKFLRDRSKSVEEKPKPPAKPTRQKSQPEAKSKDEKGKPKKMGLIERLSTKFGSKKQEEATKDEEEASRPRNPAKKEDDSDETSDDDEGDDDEETSDGEEEDKSENGDDNAKDESEDDDVATDVQMGKHKQLKRVESSTGTDSISQDSEGLVIRGVKNVKSVETSGDSITITITEFRATQDFAQVKKDDKIFVSFDLDELNLSPKDRETPLSLPRPTSSAQPAVFNFSKVVGVNRKTLSKILKKKSKIVFTVISEPSRSSGGDCEDLGKGHVDLAKEILQAGSDLSDAIVYVTNEESGETIGTLKVSVHALDVLKSLKL